ncbi:MAG: glycosyltransferase family 4 protein [Anaerolineales bacterium]|nr:glycosyltransferase family 4 protein [Anaerolineales bacterium]
MRIFIALTYYRPHYSGLTIYVERLARALAERGHRVTVLTSRYDPQLESHEVRDGVEVIRLNVLMRISKGVLMPAMPLWALKLAKRADVVSLHVPQLDAAFISLISRWLGKPTLLTYHCDLRLPKGLIHKLANQVSHLANRLSALASHAIVTNTRDYAENSSFLQHYLKKLQVIPPPVTLPAIQQADVSAFCQKANILPGQRIIGMAARLAAEKGVEYLVQALPLVLQRHPHARVLFVGQYQDVFGEEVYARKLAPMIQELGEHWTFMGVLPPAEFAAFLRQAEVTVLPSLNSTESFGMVQIESMVCGTPVVASDLPGVRQPVLTTGMGRLVPVADAAALAEAIIAILDDPESYQGDPDRIAQEYASERVAALYESAFDSISRK